jgi:photosystem II stability/assembly factor-like uncharacterized protein
MSEPSTDRFRDLATVVAPAVLMPEFDDLSRRARRHRAQRRGIAAVAAMAAVAAAVGVPAMAGYRPVDTVARIAGALTGDAPRYFGGSAGMAFVDPTTGYRFSDRCTKRAVPCELRLEATTDGGRSWQRRPAPSLAVPGKGQPADPLVQVLGRRSLLLTTGARRLLSTDGGQHWAAAPPPVAAPIAGAQETDVVDVTCAKEDCKQLRVVVVGAMTGAEAPLLNQPPLPVLYGAHARGSDGSIWVSGKRADGNTAVSTSHDGGRTWTTRPLPGWHPFSDAMFHLATVDGRTAFAAILSGPERPRDLPIARTDDGGLTWHLLPRPRGLVDADVLDMAVLPDGRLAISQQRPRPGVFASTDGISFARVGKVPVGLFFQPFPGGLLGEVESPVGVGDSEAYLTTDGRDWLKIRWETALDPGSQLNGPGS